MGYYITRVVIGVGIVNRTENAFSTMILSSRSGMSIARLKYVIPVQEQKKWICHSAVRFFQRLLEEDPGNEDAKTMLLLATSITQSLDKKLHSTPDFLLIKGA